MSIIQAAGPALRRIHVCVGGMWRRATRTVIDDDGTARVEHDDIPVRLQVQAATSAEISLLDKLPRQAEHRIVYIQHPIQPLSASRQRGGDMIRFFGADWRVTQVLEVWDQEGWSKLIVTRQSDIDAPTPTKASTASLAHVSQAGKGRVSGFRTGSEPYASLRRHGVGRQGVA